MDVVILPAAPLPQEVTPRPLDYGAWQEPIAGGTITRLDRPGNRMAIDITMPRMQPEPKGRIWVARLLQAIGRDVQIAFPQPGLDVGNPGAPVVDGASQGGLAVRLRGFTAGYAIREGQAFNFLDADGRPYLHFAAGDYQASGSGSVTIGLTPMMRFSPADGRACNFAAPVIAGRLSGNDKGWTLARAGTRGLQFSITERR